MNLIDNYLKNEHFLDLNDKHDKASQEAKLEYFFKLFIELEKKYASKIEDMKRLDAEHKQELSQLEDYVVRVKELTEEREDLTLNFKQENDQLKSKIKRLERELETAHFDYEMSLKNNHDTRNRIKSDVSSEDELSESTIEMLILEGFGNIVQAPNHEKIAVILADRSKIQSELNHLKDQFKKLQQQQQPQASKLDQSNSRLFDQIDTLETENEILKSTNLKLCEQNEEFKLENECLLKEIDDLNKKLSANSELELTKLKEDNTNFRLEVEKLYDEIGVFEIENKQLKDENGKLKLEIEDLNNELDDLVQYKANYDRLKKEFDKLSSTLKQHEKSLNEKLNSPRRSSLTPTHSFNTPTKPEFLTNNKSPQLELDWIRGENEKLLLDLEKTQTKLNDKINQYNEIKVQVAQKDEEMKEFIKKYEQNATTQDDLLALKKKLLELEEQLNAEKEEHQKDIESGEERQRDLLKRNDQLWSQWSNLEQDYKECLKLIQQQAQSIDELDTKLKETESRFRVENQEKIDEIDRNDKLSKRIENFEENRKNLESKIYELEARIRNLIEEKKDECEKSANEIESLNKKIRELEDKVVSLEREKFNLGLEIESLNKEKTFIMGQNESQNKKLMQDLLSLQEKYTSVNFELNKLNKDMIELNSTVKDKNEAFNNLEKEKNNLVLSLKQEQHEKTVALDKVRNLESLVSKNSEKLNELSEKLHRTEIQKSKLEVKSKELETLQLKFDQLNNELNEKRDALSQVLEKNGKQEIQISHLERQINETKHSLIQSESVINELTHFKSDTVQKVEENIKLKHDYDNEKLRREKAEQKIEELKEEFKKLKQKYNKLQEENSELRHENVEIKNQLDGTKSKLDLIADKSTTELEKNSALQDELSETKKKLELAEIKCSNYSQKFDMLMKKYETRKTKQKNKIERLWDYLQRERAKYKDLLANAQNDLSATKNLYDKEAEFKTKHESSYHQLLEEKSKLVATVADKETKIRELKRQNYQLQSKIKLLEEEADSLNEKIDQTLKERNKLRKEFKLNLLPGITDFYENTTSHSTSPPSSTNTHGRSSSLARTDQFDCSFKSGSLNFSNWNDFNTSSTWDINYNTGNIHKYASKSSNLIDSNLNGKLNDPIQTTNYMRSITTDINSIAGTPKSFR